MTETDWEDLIRLVCKVAHQPGKTANQKAVELIDRFNDAGESTALQEFAALSEE